MGHRWFSSIQRRSTRRQSLLLQLLKDGSSNPAHAHRYAPVATKPDQRSGHNIPRSAKQFLKAISWNLKCFVRFARKTMVFKRLLKLCTEPVDNFVDNRPRVAADPVSTPPRTDCLKVQQFENRIESMTCATISDTSARSFLLLKAHRERRILWTSEARGNKTGAIGLTP